MLALMAAIASARLHQGAYVLGRTTCAIVPPFCASCLEAISTLRSLLIMLRPELVIYMEDIGP